MAVAVAVAVAEELEVLLEVPVAVEVDKQGFEQSYWYRIGNIQVSAEPLFSSTIKRWILAEKCDKESKSLGCASVCRSYFVSAEDFLYSTRIRSNL